MLIETTPEQHIFDDLQALLDEHRAGKDSISLVVIKHFCLQMAAVAEYKINAIKEEETHADEKDYINTYDVISEATADNAETIITSIA